MEDPSRITGKWCGDTLSIPDCFDALGVGWPRTSRGKRETDVGDGDEAEATVIPTPA